MTDELDALIDQLGKSGFLLHAFQVDRYGPDILAVVFGYGGCADVMILWDEHRACAYRVPIGPAVDLFNPSRVYWHYGTDPVWTLRALLTLAPPGHPDAPTALTDAPPGYGIPVQGRMPVRVRRRGH